MHCPNMVPAFGTRHETLVLHPLLRSAGDIANPHLHQLTAGFKQIGPGVSLFS